MLKNNIRELILKNKLDDALLLIRNGLSKNRKDAELWFLRGVVALKNRDYLHASAYLNHAIELKHDAEYIKYRGILYMETGKYKTAIEIFEDVLKKDPKDVETLMYTGFCYILLDDPTSRTYIQKALHLNKQKAKKMLIEFYETFFENDPEKSEGVKQLIKRKIREL